MLGRSATQARKHRAPSSGSTTTARVLRIPSSGAPQSMCGPSAIHSTDLKLPEEDRAAGGLDADDAA
eukprot:4969978-Alexandrium_andersonii.AAC.1